jgi:rhomboid protease GluP
MDLNWLLSLIVLISSLSLVVRARGPANRGLRALASGLAVLTLVGFWLAPDYGGYVVGALWALTFLIPGLLMRAIQRAGLGQRYDKAERLLGWLSIVRPFPAIRAARDTFRALDAAQRGDVQTAQRLLEPLAAAPGTAGLRVRAELMRISQRWQELYALGFEPSFDEHAAQDPSLATLWLRALGECGLRVQLVNEWPRFAPLLARPGLEVMLDSARLMLFAFTGRGAVVDELLRERLPLMPAANAALWRATAAQAAGDARPLAELGAPELASPPEDVRRALAYRATRPPLPAEPSPREDALVAAEMAGLHQDIRYAPAALGRVDRAPVTHGLLVLIVLVFAFELYRGGSTDGKVLYELGAMWTPAVLEQGEWWRLFTFQLLHFGPLHLVMNAMALNVLGRDVERRLGGLRTACIFFVAGTFGGVLSVVLAHYGLKEPQLLVGASGGIMGFVGATVAIFLRGYTHERSAAATRQLKQALTLVALQTLIDFVTPQLSMMAHLSGVAAGFLITLALLRGSAKP